MMESTLKRKNARARNHMTYQSRWDKRYVYLVDIVGFTGYLVRNEANLKLKNITYFYDCYDSYAERSAGNWATNFKDLDITEEFKKEGVYFV